MSCAQETLIKVVVLPEGEVPPAARPIVEDLVWEILWEYGSLGYEDAVSVIEWGEKFDTHAYLEVKHSPWGSIDFEEHEEPCGVALDLESIIGEAWNDLRLRAIAMANASETQEAVA